MSSKPLDFDIDLDNLYPETWLGDTPGKRVCLRLCPPEIVEGFQKECTTPKKKAVLNTRTRKMDIADDSDFDSDRFSELLNYYTIADWDLKDVRGQVITCDDENKKRMLHIPKFAKFIAECLKVLNEQAGIAREEEVKNFESSQGE
jgi:hypothetical protein